MDTEGKFRVNEGDWICSDPQCANLNFARRISCNRCNKERESLQKKKLGQEIGKAAAEKSKGLFSADDWQCSKCCNVNWARRQQCNMCNAPKFGEVEERTGYGGGYNDRGVVEYVNREDSDDEYDEFGRRKKRKSRGEHSSPRSNSSGKNEDDEYDRKSLANDDDEEEEEEDDDDLSKYDLSEWDDLAAEQEENNTDKNNLGDEDEKISQDKENHKNDRDRSNRHSGHDCRHHRSRTRSRSPN